MGELRFRSSSEADEIASSLTGSAGTIVGSATGSGGVGGCVAVVEDGGGGEGVGRAPGGRCAPQAIANSVRRVSTRPWGFHRRRINILRSNVVPVRIFHPAAPSPVRSCYPTG